MPPGLDGLIYLLIGVSMNCIGSELSAAMVAPSADTASSASAARFAELSKPCDAQADVAQQPADTYIQGEAFGQTSMNNPIFEGFKAIQRIEIPVANNLSSTEGLTEAESFAEMGQAVLNQQAELIKTSLLMETVSSIKQGTSTLFNLQG
jgi:hypothetical protein